MAEDHLGQRHDRSVLILYGSETGNSQDAAEQLGHIAQRLRFLANVVEMDSIDLVCQVVSHFTTTAHDG